MLTSSSACVMSASLLRSEIVLTPAASAMTVLAMPILFSTVARYRAAAASTTGFLPVIAVWLETDDRISIALLDTLSSIPALAEILATFLNGSVMGGSMHISPLRSL